LLDDERRPVPMISRPAALFLVCVMTWVALAPLYVASAITNHALPPPQLNALVVGALTCLTICSFIRMTIGRLPATDMGRIDEELRCMRNEIEQNGLDRDQLIASVHDVLKINARLPGAD
jgi:hypothetical protein